MKREAEMTMATGPEPECENTTKTTTEQIWLKENPTQTHERKLLSSPTLSSNALLARRRIPSSKRRNQTPETTGEQTAEKRRTRIGTSETSEGGGKAPRNRTGTGSRRWPRSQNDETEEGGHRTAAEGEGGAEATMV